MKKVLLLILFIGLFWSNSITVYADSYLMHTVEADDTYWKLAQKYNENIDEIKIMNNASNNNLLLEGNLVRIQSLEKNITIRVDEKKLMPDQDPYIEDARTFVPIRFIAKALGAKEINWDASSKTAVLKKEGLEIELPYKSTVVLVNDTKKTLDAPINILEGRIFVPLRFVAETFNCDVLWDQEKYVVDIHTQAKLTAQSKAQSNTLKAEDAQVNTTLASAQSNTQTIGYSDKDLYWLSRIVDAEAQAEPYEGKLAVANVIINRKNSPDFPNTIKEVIFQKANGYFQFSPVSNGTIYNTPLDDSIKASKEALEGHNNIGNSLFFLNPKKSVSFWITATRKYYDTISQHDFYL